MKRFNLVSMAVVLVLLVTGVSCTTMTGTQDDNYSRQSSRRVYVEDPYRGTVVMERDPYTGRYYEVGTYGSTYSRDPYYNNRVYRSNGGYYSNRGNVNHHNRNNNSYRNNNRNYNGYSNNAPIRKEPAAPATPSRMSSEQKKQIQQSQPNARKIPLDN